MQNPACQWHRSYAQAQNLQSLAVIITVIDTALVSGCITLANIEQHSLTDLLFVPQACLLWQLMA